MTAPALLIWASTFAGCKGWNLEKFLPSSDQSGGESETCLPQLDQLMCPTGQPVLCRGHLVSPCWAKLEEGECTAEGFECTGELVPAEICDVLTLGKGETCLVMAREVDSKTHEYKVCEDCGGCRGPVRVDPDKYIPPKVCRECSDNCKGPLRIDKHKRQGEKKDCKGVLSLTTVHGLTCKKQKRSGFSSCRMGPHGFSFCDTEQLFFRDGHWYDWDLCGFCSPDNSENPLTPYGRRCLGECHNRWNNRESHIPRCKVDQIEKDDPELDFCVSCTTDCPSVKIDDRFGSEVGTWKPDR